MFDNACDVTSLAVRLASYDYVIQLEPANVTVNIVVNKQNPMLDKSTHIL